MTKALSVKQLKKTYKNGVEALKGIDLDVEQGEFFALLGPNGAGKSTFIGIVNSLIIKTSGDIQIFGIDFEKKPAHAKQYIGLVPQEINLNIFETPFNILCYQAGYYGVPYKIARERAEFYLKTLELWDKRDTPVRMLSGGMKRRLMIARSLVHEPKLLFLDEPTAGVDIEIRRSMWKFLTKLNEQGTTIILTTHYLEEAESLCKKIAIIDHGELIEHTEMKNVLSKLSLETFVLDLKHPLPHDFKISYPSRKVDDTTLEVDIEKDKDINTLFNELSHHQINVLSMKNKSNRLEELFIRLISEPKS